MGTAKKQVKKRRQDRSAAEVSSVIPKAQMLRKDDELTKAISLAREHRRAESRVDPRTNRKRDYTDRIDDLEMRIMRHGRSMHDVERLAKKWDEGARTDVYAVAHAVFEHWVEQPLSATRVVWVDPKSGYDERTVPKLSTASGQDLVSRGLAGVGWAHSRRELLALRAWKLKMLQLTPGQRLTNPPRIGGLYGHSDEPELSADVDERE